MPVIINIHVPFVAISSRVTYETSSPIIIYIAYLSFFHIVIWNTSKHLSAP